MSAGAMRQPNQDKIKLAEAMGWKLVEHCGTERWIAPGSLGFTGYLNEPNFDPLTDANDDYAVLAFFRNHKDYRQAFEKALVLSTENMGVIWRYKVGAYARAALSTLNTRRDL